ncbi:MAG: DUF1659 domain-containing protein [Clostridiales bacterium]|nr:DUF1659 domain-containing protein [Clostridiales bacterium]
MALEVNSLDSRLQIQFHLGVNEDGKDITKTKSYSRIKDETTHEDLYEVANSLVDLQENPVIAIRRTSLAEYVGD